MCHKALSLVRWCPYQWRDGGAPRKTVFAQIYCHQNSQILANLTEAKRREDRNRQMDAGRKRKRLVILGTSDPSAFTGGRREGLVD